MQGEVVQEISAALGLLNIPTSSFRLLDDMDGEKIYNSALQNFVLSGDRRWWWEDFRMPSFRFKSFDYPPDHIEEVLPDTQSSVWLIVEDDREAFYPVFEVKNISDIGRVLNECFGFEYYIIEKNYQWLLCETHHKQLIGIGDILRSKNKDIIERDLQR